MDTNCDDDLSLDTNNISDETQYDIDTISSSILEPYIDVKVDVDISSCPDSDVVRLLDSNCELSGDYSDTSPTEPPSQNLSVYFLEQETKVPCEQKKKRSNKP